MTVGKWTRRIGYVVLCLAILAAGTYSARRTLILNLARVTLNRDSGMVAQERKDGVAIAFGHTSSGWTTPLKNEMNEIWHPAQVQGVNYYTFGGPRSWFSPYSERSNPRSPYYQAWVGGYVIRKADGTLPNDPQLLASELTNLDQRSWLEAMGDPQPVSVLDSLTSAGSILIDGSNWPLWHGIYRSHSDLSANATSELAQIIGMPDQSAWPAGVSPFHDVILEGYLAWKVQPKENVTVVIYAVAARYAAQSLALGGTPALSRDELLAMMRSASLRTVN